MGKPNTYHAFLRALKKRWTTDLPTVQPLSEPRGSLPKAGSFYAGCTPDGKLHIYLHFQTHHNLLGRFTINVVLSRDEFFPRHYLAPGQQRVLADLIEGPNRIGALLHTPHGDKWWVLCRIPWLEELSGSPDSFATDPSNWRPKDWDDTARTIDDAVADVTQSVRLALSRLTKMS